MKRKNQNTLDSLFFTSSDDISPSNKRVLPWRSFLLICGGWILFWYLTPGLHANGIGSMLIKNNENSIILETITALIIVILLMLMHKRYNQLLIISTISLVAIFASGIG